jgi:hypothetical protein
MIKDFHRGVELPIGIIQPSSFSVPVPDRRQYVPPNKQWKQINRRMAFKSKIASLIGLSVHWTNPERTVSGRNCFLTAWSVKHRTKIAF